MTNEQKQTAQSIFDKKKDIDTLYMNPKGEFFTNENLGKNSLGKDEKLKKINRVYETLEDENKPLNVAQIKEQVEAITQVAELEEMLKTEFAGLNRKGAIEAIEKRIEELKNAN